MGVGVALMCIVFSIDEARKGEWYPAAVLAWMGCGSLFVWCVSVLVEKQKGSDSGKLE